MVEAEGVGQHVHRISPEISKVAGRRGERFVLQGLDYGEGTVAVLLPGAYYLLRETQCPPVDLFRKHRVAMAIASDANPGTSPALSLRLMINMACTLFRLTPEEALAGVTVHAAKALGLQDSHGTLETGKAE